MQKGHGYQDGHQGIYVAEDRSLLALQIAQG